MGAMINVYTFWSENLTIKDEWADLGVDGRYILKVTIINRIVPITVAARSKA
jgi:hypothetical protein